AQRDEFHRYRRGDLDFTDAKSVIHVLRWIIFCIAFDSERLLWRCAFQRSCPIRRQEDRSNAACESQPKLRAVGVEYKRLRDAAQRAYENMNEPAVSYETTAIIINRSGFRLARCTLAKYTPAPHQQSFVRRTLEKIDSPAIQRA